MSKSNKFVSLLTRTNNKIQEDRAKRIGSSVEDALTVKKITIKGEVNEIRDRLEAMLDLSASNDTTSANRIKNFDATKFVNERHELRMQLALKEEELALIEEDMEELLGTEEAE